MESSWGPNPTVTNSTKSDQEIEAKLLEPLPVLSRKHNFLKSEIGNNAKIQTQNTHAKFGNLQRNGIIPHYRHFTKIESGRNKINRSIIHNEIELVVKSPIKEKLRTR